ncbi:TonB-dependent receptor [Flaviramulus sp. BrNp1-15]|uniref:TonB-dependent receptor n=1 Tax=Flaviramulus sp. BrNp1-15 TaxID=2916754 RepID=UPI001EE91C00|nr:TonB-dependent receptor [Flaviramulus sp. BrNp1-15]ULC59004.1 TonB-dependent receptor [Flaviramulus sp. BrNp1-15]
MIKKLILLTTFLFSITFVFGQQGNIKGKVLSSQGYAIENANVLIINSDYGTYTNRTGEFLIENVKSGTYKLKVTYVGYKTQEISINVKNNETTNLPAIILVDNEEELNEILVEGIRNNKYTKRETSSSLRIKGELIKQPQNIQVISSDLLIDQQVTSIMDGVIRNVSGVTMLEHWGHFARVNMRGFRLPAFRNGINVQDTWGPLSEDMNTVDRIEFVKGPAGFMMSAGEPGGFYNVVTKKPTATPTAQISLAAGSFDYYRGTVDVGGKLTEDGKLLGRFNGMYQTSDTHRGDEDVKRFGIAPALTYNISDKTSITTELNLQQAESLIGSAYVFAPANSGYGSLDRDFKFTDTNYPKTDIQEVTLFTNFKHEISKNWSFETQFALLRYNQEGNSTWLWNFADTGDATRYVSNWDALSNGKYFQTYLYGNFNTGNITHNILGGFDYSQKEYWADWSQAIVIDINQPFNIYNPIYGNTETPVFDRSVDLKNRVGVYNYGNIVRAFYAQDEIGLVDNKIRLTLAGRYTELVTNGKTETDTKFTPRFGLSADILPNLTAYALYDQSFLGQTGVSESGDYFDPVEANDIEGGLKTTLLNGRLKASLGVYQITKENVLVTDPENVNFSIQLGEIQSKGIEFDVQGEITPELNIVFNYANTNVEITEDTNPDNIGNRVAGHAKHMTNGWLNYNFANTSKLKGFGASLGYQYQVDRSAWAWGADNQSDLPDYFRLDGGLSWKNKKMRVQLNINNILDEYLYSGSNYGTYLYWQSEPGINGRVTLTYNF